MCSACRFSLSLYFSLLPRGIISSSIIRPMIAASSVPNREWLRHTVATLAYRGGKAVRGAPAKFSDVRVKDGSRTAGQILAHVGDLLDWALSIAKGAEVWPDPTPPAWAAGVARVFAPLAKRDAALGARPGLG